ncbi:MAG: hypothetical protein AAGE13_15100 [Pseudomonadota bacterium]
MPLLLLVLGALGAGLFWYYRIRNAAEATREITEMASDVQSAARRFGFKRRADIHPADAVDDARLVGAALALVIAAHERIIGADGHRRLSDICRDAFDCTQNEAEEIVVFARWLEAQFSNRDEAARRLTRRLNLLARGDVLPDLERMVGALAPPGPDGYGEDTQAVLERSRRILRGG